MKTDDNIIFVVAMLISAVIIAVLLTLPVTIFAFLMSIGGYISTPLATNIVRSSIVASSIVGVVIYLLGVREQAKSQ